MGKLPASREFRASFRQSRYVALALILSFSAVMIYGTATYWKNQAANEIRQKAAETLAVQTEILNGVLEKYRMVPPLMSRQNDLIALFPADPGASVSLEWAKAKAEEIAGLSGAKEVVFLYPDGSLLTAARDIYTPDAPGAATMAKAARDGVLGRMAVSLDSEDRAYAFASGVRRGGRLVGIVVAYIGFEGIERTWSLTRVPVFVTDENNVIILTNQWGWRHKNAEEVLGGQGSARDYVNLARDLPLLGWELHVLAELAPARSAGVAAASVAALLSVLAGSVVMLLLNRRERLQWQIRRDKAVALRLERIVRDRTRALSATNESLSYEVEERKQTEEKLKKAQTELIQTAKLAVLGQMAATLSHEMNQPLAAMRTYANNALRFLELSRSEEAGSAITRMAAMVDRMAELSGALLSFSRRPGTEKRPVELTAVIEEALILLRPRARKEGVTLIVDSSVGKHTVMGGRIRLSQIVVNLVNNAMDAMRDQRNARVKIWAQEDGDEVILTISDNGPGIADDLRERIFDPFFTTKPQGEGVGVGLSIVYNIVQDFGGSIRLIEDGKPGCTFEIRLQVAPVIAEALN